MLTQLTVDNLAIADHVELFFERGMSVITGETGAGKSIILDALGLTLGDRADSGLVRHGADRTDISAVFDISNIPNAQAWLKANDLHNDSDLDDQYECILRRVITSEGRSRGYINGQPSALSNLREVGEMLIDIHSQHEHQSLLKKETHRRLIDEYGNLKKQAQDVATHYKSWSDKAQKLEQLKNNQDEQDARLQLLKYQVKELNELGLTAEELPELEKEQQSLSHAEQLLSSGHEVLQACSDGESTVQSILSHALHTLDALPVKHEALFEAQNLLSEALIQVDEATHSIRGFVDHFEIDPTRLQEVDERLSAIYQLARKHKTTPEELPALHQSLVDELKSFEDGDGNIEILTTETAELAEKYLTTARKLSQARIKTALTLDKKIAGQLSELGMPSVKFITQISPLPDNIFTRNGLEDIEFLVSANPGQPPKPLNKVASGGELSRISLAIQVVTAQTSAIPTLVFDEVDVGIGGGTAEVVGRLLRALGEKGQALCITHQPQVASQGHHHLFVSKQTNKKETHSKITKLNKEGRTEEVARMLGGINMTEQTLAHAREMLSATALEI
ncbi:DNA repair protein RecN [Alkalimarinus alittae]|uniref:DNA repair protein RecN n=1 Tax=Alkalimarinus alittae TaxID=2961619 RepID=A0ABY6N3Y8_9ALTE|nr:DNA repair protein RecN [Alkalimarinus alittae]UZE96838.1 DNA repair protein RecN [Alkalimarinus alittae]